MTNDYINFVARMGNATSVQTFENGVNCVVTVDFDYDSIYNNIQVLGYGSGDNQIKYTDQDATSVSTYGQRDLTINESAIRDAATAQRYAEELISKLKDKKTLIKIEWVLGVEQLVARRGDKITVVDEISGNEINGVYRVYRITYKDDGTTILECVDEDTSKPLKFNEIMNSIRTNIVGESNYAKGSRRRVSFPVYGKTSDTVKGQLVVNLNDTIPTNADIVSATLRFKRVGMVFDISTATGSHPHNQNYMTQSTHAHDQNYMTQSNHPHDQNYMTQTNHSHNISAGQTTALASGIGSYVSAGSEVGTITGTKTGGTWYDFDTNIDIGTSTTGLTIFWIKITTPAAAGNSFVRLKVSGESVYYPDSTGYEVNSDGVAVPILILISDDLQNKDLDLRYKVTSTTSDNIDYEYAFMAVGKHTHGVAGVTTVGVVANFTDPDATDGSEATFTDPQYVDGTNANFTDAEATDGATAPLNRGVYLKGGESAYNFNIDVGGVNKDTVNSIDVGTDSGEIDLTSSLNTKGQHYVEIYPTTTGEAFIVGELQVEYWGDDI